MFIYDEKCEFEFLDIKFSISDIRLQTMSAPYPVHYHGLNTVEIHYLKDGSGTVLINDNEFNIKKNDIFIVGAFVEHTQLPNPNDPMEKYSIYISFDDSKCNDEAIKSLFKNPTWVGEDKNNIGRIFDYIYSEALSKKLGYKLVIENAIKILIIDVIRNEQFIVPSNSSISQSDNRRFEIEKIFLNEFASITLSDMASKLGTSERELQRYIKKTYNKTFMDLKLEARMNYAASRLMYTDISISDLAEKVGYSSTEHFSFAFKQFFGSSPLSYKKNKAKK